MPDAIVFEERSIPLSEVRADVSGDGISGHAVVFNQRTAIGDPKTWGFYEEVAPGATRKAVEGSDIMALWNHNADHPLARKSAGTLDLAEDDHGLRFDIPKLPDTSAARDLRENVRNGNVTGVSYAFRATEGGQEWSELEDGSQLRRITEFEELREVSPVTFPAFGGTTVGLRDAVSAARESGRADDPKAPYGDVTYADPGYQSDKKKRYPLDTKEHVKAAWSYINQSKNAAAYSSSQLASIKSKIRAAAKKFGVTISDDQNSRALVILGELQELLGALAPTDDLGGSDDNDEDDYNAENPRPHDVNEGDVVDDADRSTADSSVSEGEAAARRAAYQQRKLRARALAALHGLK